MAPGRASSKMNALKQGQGGHRFAAEWPVGPEAEG